MSVVVQCDHCHSRFRVHPDKLGHWFRCPSCGNRFLADSAHPTGNSSTSHDERAAGSPPWTTDAQLWDQLVKTVSRELPPPPRHVRPAGSDLESLVRKAVPTLDSGESSAGLLQAVGVVCSLLIIAAELTIAGLLLVPWYRPTSAPSPATSMPVATPAPQPAPVPEPIERSIATAPAPEAAPAPAEVAAPVPPPRQRPVSPAIAPIQPSAGMTIYISPPSADRAKRSKRTPLDVRTAVARTIDFLVESLEVEPPPPDVAARWLNEISAAVGNDPDVSISRALLILKNYRYRVERAFVYGSLSDYYRKNSDFWNDDPRQWIDHRIREVPADVRKLARGVHNGSAMDAQKLRDLGDVGVFAYAAEAPRRGPGRWKFLCESPSEAAPLALLSVVNGDSSISNASVTAALRSIDSTRFHPMTVEFLTIILAVRLSSPSEFHAVSQMRDRRGVAGHPLGRIVLRSALGRGSALTTPLVAKALATISTDEAYNACRRELEAPWNHNNVSDDFARALAVIDHTEAAALLMSLTADGRFPPHTIGYLNASPRTEAAVIRHIRSDDVGIHLYLSGWLAQHGSESSLKAIDDALAARPKSAIAMFLRSAKQGIERRRDARLLREASPRSASPPQ